MKKRVWRADWIGYHRAELIDLAHRRRRAQKPKPMTKEEFRRAVMAAMMTRGGSKP